MKQIYYPYWEWEDYQSGMYDYTNKEDAVVLIALAKDLLGDPLEFDKEARDMIFNWPNATAHNLTNKSINRKAWIGQAACCFSCNTPEILTRLAWVELTIDQRIKANNIAQGVIQDYENQNQ